MPRWISQIIIFLFSCMFILSASAIAVSPMIVHLQSGGRAYADITVSNPSSKKAYVSIEAKRIENPGEKNEKAIFIKNPKKFGLITSPTKMVIPPNKTRRVRLLLTAPRKNREIIFELMVSPHAGQLKKQEYAGGVRATLKVLVSYGVRVVVLPSKPMASLDIQRKGNQLVVTNNGNINVLLFNGKQCLKETCKKLTMKRLYAGNIWTLPLPYHTPASFSVQDHAGKIKVISSS